MTRAVALMRAREDAERTAARLAELGRESVIAPVTEIVATGAKAPPGPFDIVVATSAKAFDLLEASARDPIVGLPLFVVGARTARAAAAKGLAIDEPAAPDVAALVARLSARRRSRVSGALSRGPGPQERPRIRARGGRPSCRRHRGLRGARETGMDRRGGRRRRALRRRDALFGEERGARGAARRKRGHRGCLSVVAACLHFRGHGGSAPRGGNRGDSRRANARRGRAVRRAGDCVGMRRKPGGATGFHPRRSRL